MQLRGENYRKVAASTDPLARAVIENYEIWRRAGDSKVKEPATGQLDALRHRGHSPGPLPAVAEMEELPLVVTQDGFTRIDPKASEFTVRWRGKTRPPSSGCWSTGSPPGAEVERESTSVVDFHNRVEPG